ncbi:hypothetical protein AB0E77_31955 [Streptomyces sp. NPDC032940]|uniref:hypothetical protein n=1 Tax=Streptomyces sp. NPDC032940 TaxID=3155366 RepID=UPI0033DCB146
MTHLVPERASTDRQNLVLKEAGIENQVVLEEEAGTSSLFQPLQRPTFGELPTCTRPHRLSEGPPCQAGRLEDGTEGGAQRTTSGMWRQRPQRHPVARRTSHN